MKYYIQDVSKGQRLNFTFELKNVNLILMYGLLKIFVAPDLKLRTFIQVSAISQFMADHV